MQKEKKHIRSLMLLTAAVAVASPACVWSQQAVDYGSLQSLFGEPITTSATGTPQRAGDVAANMTIITADQIRQSGSRNIPLIIGQYVPGIDVLQTGVQDFNVGVRGYQQPMQPRLLVLIDGRQAFLNDYSYTDWNNLPVNIDDIRQIEVVKGAASALFGSNATGGVVNIITYSPLYDKDNVADARLGTQRERNADATATAHFGDWGGLKISAGDMVQDEFSTPRPISYEQNPIDPYTRYAVANSVFQINPKLSVNAEVTYSKSDDNLTIYTDLLSPFQQEDYSFRGGVSWQSPFGLISDNTYYNGEIYHGDPSGDYPALWGRSGLVVSQLQDQFKLSSDHTFRLMFEYRDETFNSGDDTAFIPQNPVFNHEDFALGGTWLWDISDKLSFTNALRGDHNNTSMDGSLFPGSFYQTSDYTKDYNTISANSGLVYKATDMDTLRATYGRGIENPSLIQAGSNFNNVSAVTVFPILDIEGNPDLKPTIVSNYELGYDRKIPAIDSTAKFSVYYVYNQDLMAPSPILPVRFIGGVPFVLVQFQNVGTSQGEGGEIELAGKSASGFRWDASYSFQTIQDASLVSQTLNYNGSAPENHYRLLLGYTHGSWEFDAAGQYVSSTTQYRQYPTSLTPSLTATTGYESLSARIGYNITDNITAALTGTNLSSQTTSESPYPDIERQVFLGLTAKF